ncbi:hypothetical protein GCM10010124_00650 [Pilimelia terevasa]|uniref:Uncharacterized protein n=1 Tax=Pilimelia terevasa TaxID=53372 RepID=A0A8J3FF89_9ACTN|nr:hypothetical protein [Pilimelia terevasa]GGK11895.1 hypothetical protein GCM10010124_00650 [Pilimelia terevasa]
MDIQRSDGGPGGGQPPAAARPGPAPRPRPADPGAPPGPSTSAAGPRPVPPAADAPADPADGRWSRQRLWLGVGAGSVILLLAGGVGLGVVLYADATTPRTDTPDATVDNYLRALLVDRSIDAARDLACPQVGGLAAVEDLRDEAIDREREFPDGRVQITWGALATTPEGPGRVTVETDVSVMGVFDSQVRSRRVDTWRFGLVSDGGWQVCRAEKL